MAKIELAPSILSADFARLADQVKAVERGGADLIHVDVMDGHFVPNITIGPLVVRALRGVTELPLDVHLMIERPEQFVQSFAEAGSNLISVHVEAAVHLERLIARIKSLGNRAGVVLNPATPLVLAEEIIPTVDFVLLMSVNPGFPAQKFIASVLNKVARLREMLDRTNPQCRIEVDGGITLQNVESVVKAGAQMIVAGSAIFDTPDPEATARSFKAKLASVKV